MLAQAVGQSLPLTAWLSAVHVLGFTLVMSGGLVWNLKAAGALLGSYPLESVARPAGRILIIGLAISLITGLALFAPRATSVASSGVFQLKMSLLLGATCYQLALFFATAQRLRSPSALPIAGAIGVSLWLALAVTACWFILFE